MCSFTKAPTRNDLALGIESRNLIYFSPLESNHFKIKIVKNIMPTVGFESSTSPYFQDYRISWV